MAKKKAITAEEFVIAWQTSNNYDEVVAKTGLPRRACQSKACLFRKRGIKLKVFERQGRTGPPPLDVPSLNKLIDQLTTNPLDTYNPTATYVHETQAPEPPLPDPEIVDDRGPYGYRSQGF